MGAVDGDIGACLLPEDRLTRLGPQVPNGGAQIQGWQAGARTSTSWHPIPPPRCKPNIPRSHPNPAPLEPRVGPRHIFW